MILTDTGPLLALLVKKDAQHQRCVDALKTLPPEPMLTTWPCFTEAMHLLGAAGGYRFQSFLWKLIEDEKMNKLMQKYEDTSMDLADASLVVLAETMQMKQIFTIDSDFYIYRLADGSRLEVIP
jgi:hypothetical protein